MSIKISFRFTFNIESNLFTFKTKIILASSDQKVPILAPLGTITVSYYPILIFLVVLAPSDNDHGVVDIGPSFS